jgi:hypothetical protein
LAHAKDVVALSIQQHTSVNSVNFIQFVRLSRLFIKTSITSRKHLPLWIVTLSNEASGKSLMSMQSL